MSFPSTRPTLLSRLRKGDDAAWRVFVESYTGPALAYLVSLGLGPEDAEDLWQEFYLKSETVLNSHQPEQGRFSNLLMSVLRRMFIDARRHSTAGKRGGGKVVSTDLPLSPDDPDGARLIDRLEAGDDAHRERICDTVRHHLNEILAAHFGGAQRRAYLDWFEHCDEEIEDDIARRNGMAKHQLRYLCRKVNEHFRKRWEKNEEPEHETR